MNFPVELDDWIETPEASGDVGREMYGLEPFRPLPAFKKNAVPKWRSRNSQGSLEAFDVLFSRYRRVLSLVAYRVLDSHVDAEIAVQNCLLAVSDNVPKFENEGAFRCWLVRVLIDEAVAILNRRKANRRW